MLKEQSWSIYPWDGQNNKLQVLKEKDTHAIIILNDAYENGDPITFRIWRPKNGILNAPWTKWKYKLTDIVNAIDDACREYNKYTI